MTEAGTKEDKKMFSAKEVKNKRAMALQTCGEYCEKMISAMDGGMGHYTMVAREQNLIPSFPWIAPGRRV